METMEVGAEFDPTRCPVCGAEGYVDDEGIVRCSSCFAELPGDGLDWDSDLVWAEDSDQFTGIGDPAIDPEDYLMEGQRGPNLSERARRRDALVHREEGLLDRERIDLDELADVDDEAMLPDYSATGEFVTDVEGEVEVEGGAADDLYL